MCGFLFDKKSLKPKKIGNFLSVLVIFCLTTPLATAVLVVKSSEKLYRCHFATVLYVLHEVEWVALFEIAAESFYQICGLRLRLM